MKSLNRRVVINGKKITEYKVDIMVQDIVDYITLEGFSTVEELDDMVSVNGYYNDYLIDKILDKLHNTYSSAIYYTRKNADVDKAKYKNIMALIRKESIVLELMKNISNDSISEIELNKKNNINISNSKDDISKFSKVVDRFMNKISHFIVARI